MHEVLATVASGIGSDLRVLRLYLVDLRNGPARLGGILRESSRWCRWCSLWQCRLSCRPVQRFGRFSRSPPWEPLSHSPHRMSWFPDRFRKPVIRSFPATCNAMSNLGTIWLFEADNLVCIQTMQTLDATKVGSLDDPGVDGRIVDKGAVHQAKTMVRPLVS